MSRAILTRRTAPYVFLAPAAAFGAVFFVLPLAASLYLSFTSWNALAPPRWIGTANYRFLLTADPLFLRSLLNTAVFAAGSLAVGVPLALLLAQLLYPSRLRALWRSVLCLPMVTNVVAVGFIWWFVLADTWGLLNRLLALVGIAGPAWLNDPSTAMAAVVGVFVWMHLGQNMLLFTAGLDAVDPSCREAARLDGAGEAAVFRHVVLPLLRPTLLFVLVTNMITAVSYFALVLVLTEGGPANATNVSALYIYQMAFADLRLGRASAAAYVLTLLILIVSLVQFRLMRRGGLEAY